MQGRRKFSDWSVQSESSPLQYTAVGSPTPYPIFYRGTPIPPLNDCVEHKRQHQRRELAPWDTKSDQACWSVPYIMLRLATGSLVVGLGCDLIPLAVWVEVDQYGHRLERRYLSRPTTTKLPAAYLRFVFERARSAWCYFRLCLKSNPFSRSGSLEGGGGGRNSIKKNTLRMSGPRETAGRHPPREQKVGWPYEGVH